MRLYRAVSQVELDDLEQSGLFRLDPDGFVWGKWFALAPDAAAEWGRRFASFDGRGYYVIETDAPDSVAATFTILPNLDNIGAAVFVEEYALPMLRVLTATPILFIE